MDIPEDLKNTMDYIRANEDDITLVKRLKKAAEGEMIASGVTVKPTNEFELEQYKLAIDMLTAFYYDNRGVVELSNNVKNSVGSIVLKISRNTSKEVSK